MATRKKKAKTQDERPAILGVPLPGGIEVECAAPALANWDRYIEKVRRDQELVGRRELVQVSCISHSVEQVQKILNRFPVIANTITNTLDDLCGGDVEPVADVEAGEVRATLDGVEFTFNGPDMDSWERFQENMQNEKTKYGANMREFLVAHSTDPTALAVALEKNPCAAGPLVASVGEIAGAGFKVVVKKG